MKTLLASVVIIIAAAIAEGQDARLRLESFGRALENSVLKVSHPSAASLFGGAHSCRIYSLHGLGALFILPPRRLPPASGSAARSDQRLSPQPTDSRSSLVGRVHSNDNVSDQEQELRAAELQALAFQQAAAMMRREVERSMSAMAQEVESMISTGHSRGPGERSSASDSFFLPPDPPWRYWFNVERPVDNRTPQQVLNEVRESVVRTFVDRGELLNALASGESVIVIIDFFSSDMLDASFRPTRTLVIRVGADDLSGIRDGRFTLEDLRNRLLFDEY